MNAKVQNISISEVRRLSDAWNQKYAIGKITKFPLAWSYEERVSFQPIPRHCTMFDEEIISVPGYRPRRIPNTYDCIAFVKEFYPQYYQQFKRDQEARIASQNKTFKAIDYHCHTSKYHFKKEEGGISRIFTH